MKTRRRKLNIRTGEGIFQIVLESYGNERGYTALVPKIPEIVTGGFSISESKKMAKEAIEFSVECDRKEQKTHREYHTNSKSKGYRPTSSPSRI